jgi:hypothetical protein
LLTIDIGYFAGSPNDANLGLFAGGFTIPIQLNFDIADNFQAALGYGYSWQPGGARTGGNVEVAGATSVLGLSPFLWVDGSGNIQESATSANHYKPLLLLGSQRSFQC